MKSSWLRASTSFRVLRHLFGVKDLVASALNNIHLTDTFTGLTSIYRWEGKINKDRETLMMIKSRSTMLDALTKWVRQEHPYDECEVISVPITGGSSSYIQWVLDSSTVRGMLFPACMQPTLSSCRAGTDDVLETVVLRLLTSMC